MHHHITFSLFCSTGPFLISRLVGSSPKSLMKVLAVVSASMLTRVFDILSKCPFAVGGDVSVCLLQLSPVLSSTLMVSFLARGRPTHKSRSGIWRNAPTWPTSPATLALSPPLLSLRTDTIWPQVRTPAYLHHCCLSLMCSYCKSGCKVAGTFWVFNMTSLSGVALQVPRIALWNCGIWGNWRTSRPSLWTTTMR